MTDAEAGARLAMTLGNGTKSSTNGSAFRIGTILEGGQGRLRIACDGLSLEPEDLWLAPPLSYHWTEDSGQPDLLRVGERVLLLSLDDQDYYLIAKAVKA